MLPGSFRGLQEVTSEAVGASRKVFPGSPCSRTSPARIIATAYLSGSPVAATPSPRRGGGHDDSVSHRPRPFIPPFSPTGRRSARSCVPRLFSTGRRNCRINDSQCEAWCEVIEAFIFLENMPAKSLRACGTRTIATASSRTRPENRVGVNEDSSQSRRPFGSAATSPASRR
jgi:hypothetical protein